MFDFLKQHKTEPAEIPTSPIAKSVPAKGKIFIADKRGAMLPFSFAKASDELSSKQLTGKEQATWLREFDLIDRPFSPSIFILLKDRCPILGAAVDVIANDVSSTGWSLALKEDAKQSSETDSERKELEAFLKKPNDEDSLKELISACITDLQTIGDFSLEVARNNTNKIGSVFHVPAHTLFRNKDADRFVQKRNTKTVFFVPFGSGIVANIKTGKEEEGEFDRKTKANELIFKKLYNSTSSYYGRSPMLSCIGAVLCSISCEEYNLNYFDNRGVPNFAVLLSGEWEEGGVKKLAAYMQKEMKGNENIGRTMVLQVPQDGKAEFEPLDNREKEGSFRLYAQDLDDKILGVYKVPRCKVSIQRVGRLSGTDTAESLRNYNDSVVEPMQNIVEDIFNTKILPEVLGSELHFNFVLNNLHIDDFKEKAETYVKLLERGCVTPNEVRQRLALGKEYDEGQRFFIGSTLIPSGEPSEGNLSKEEQEFLEKQNENN